MTGEKLRDEFRTLVHDTRKTAVFITHSIDEALRIGDRIVVLSRPARIALDVTVDRKQADTADIRRRILEILGT